MKLTIEIPDELGPSYERFIAKYHAEQRFDSLSGALIVTPKYTVEEFLVFQVDALNDRVEQEFPAESTQAERDQIAALEQQISEKRKTRPVRGVPVQGLT